MRDAHWEREFRRVLFRSISYLYILLCVFLKDRGWGGIGDSLHIKLARYSFLLGNHERCLPFFQKLLVDRSEGSRVGTECVSTSTSRWSPCLSNNTTLYRQMFTHYLLSTTIVTYYPQ